MTPEIYTHNGFIKFNKDLVTANPNLDAFYRLDIIELLKSQSTAVINPRTIFVLERNEKQTVGEDNSHVHERRTIAFLILKVGKLGDYAGHDAIYSETEDIAHSFLDQIEEYKDNDDEDSIPPNDIIHVYRNEVSINQVGPLVGYRYGVRVVFQMITKGRPPVD